MLSVSALSKQAAQASGALSWAMAGGEALESAFMSSLLQPGQFCLCAKPALFWSLIFRL